MNMNSCASWRPVHRYSLCVRVYHPELIAELLSPFQFLCNLIITILSIWYILCVMTLFWMPNLSKLSYIIFELLKAVTGWHTKLFVAHDFNWITWKCWIDGTGKDWTETQAWQGKRLKDRKTENPGTVATLAVTLSLLSSPRHIIFLGTTSRLNFARRTSATAEGSSPI